MTPPAGRRAGGTAGAKTPDRLDDRALNRATLGRQLLLRRTPMAVPDALEHLVGLQAQVPNVPYVALWNRLADFVPEQLASLLRERSAVRVPLLRATIHVVTARDCQWLRPLHQGVMERTFASTAWAKNLAGKDLAGILAAGRLLVEERPRSRAELAQLLAQRWPGVDAASLAIAVTYLLPVLQVPPRGLWGESGQAVWTTTAAWLGAEPREAPDAVDDAVRRYLRAFGPASVKDMQAWSRLSQLREVVERLRPGLRRFVNSAGAELFDLPDAPLPDRDTPVAPRFLPEYDNALLGYADRRRVLAVGDHVPLLGGPGGYVGTVLVDGFVSAMWALRRTGGAAVLDIRPSLPLPADQRGAVEAEAARLLALLAPGTEPDIRFTA